MNTNEDIGLELVKKILSKIFRTALEEIIK